MLKAQLEIVDESGRTEESASRVVAKIVFQVKTDLSQDDLDALRVAIESYIDDIDVARRMKSSRLGVGTLEQDPPLESSLVRRAQASAARGATAVSQQLQRLRDQGKIDDNDRLLISLPDDMKPGSQTDL